MYNIEQIAGFTPCKAYFANKNSTIETLSLDSRTIYNFKNTLFFAIVSKTGNGHRYIPTLYKEGVRNFCVSEIIDLSQYPDANFLVVENTIEALQNIATAHRKQFDIPVLGITGSNGKTIVKEWIATLLMPYFSITRSPKSFNSQIGVPLSVFKLSNESQLGIFEAGISLPNEMARLEKIIQPTVGIFTNVGTAHEEGFASQNEKLSEKLQLFKHSKALIYNAAYPIENAIKAINPAIELISWGIDNPQANIQVSLKIANNATQIMLTYQGNTYQYTLPFTDSASEENAINALCFCLYMGETELATEQLESVDMRLAIKQGINNCLLIDDAYSSDIHSLSIALDVLNAQSKGKYTALTLILSDIVQSGLPDDALYPQMAALIQEKNISRFVGIGKNMQQYWQLFPANSRFYPTTAAFLNSNEHIENEAILIKGARRFSFEDISRSLANKMHQTTMEVDLTALVHNFKHLRSFLKPTTKTVAMIKADAYGCGAVEVAQVLQHNGCEYFGVALADEGVELRKKGIFTPIMVMNPEQESFALLTEYMLEPEVYNFSLLTDFIAFVKKQGLSRYPVHIKIDTGMHRLGFEQKDLEKLATMLRENVTYIRVASVFSHLHSADEEEKNAVVENQVENFKTATEYLRIHLKDIFIRHILNTAGVQKFAQYQFEMVRLGIGLYGVGLGKNSPIENVASLKTIILQTRDVSQKDTVGYNQRGVLQRDSKIAAIPIGYADGLNRAFGRGNGYALVHGKKAPFVGNICMDVAMIDITDIPEAKEGDQVIIFGKEHTISELAAQINTIPYEVLTHVSSRVKRVYIQE